MSGAEVVIGVGIAANFIQLIDFSINVCRRLRNGSKPSATMKRVEGVLDLAEELREFMASKAGPQFLASPRRRKAVMACLHRLKELEDFAKSILPKDDDGKLKLVLREIRRPRDENKVDSILGCLHSNMQTLQLQIAMWTAIQVQTLHLQDQAVVNAILAENSDISSQFMPPALDDRTGNTTVATTFGTIVSESSTKSASTLPLTSNEKLPAYRRKQTSPCARGTCPCRCHVKSLWLYQDWKYYGSTIASMLTSCNCTKKSYGWNYHSRGLQKLFQLELSFDFENGFSFTIKPSMIVTVPRASRGFEVLYKFQKGFINADQVISTLDSYFANNVCSIYDVDPDGDGWIEVSFPFHSFGLTPMSVHFYYVSKSWLCAYCSC
jgi:hypothetical protein